jgi:hypothetical protein
VYINQKEIGHRSYWINGNVELSSVGCKSADIGLHSSLNNRTKKQK